MVNRLHNRHNMKHDIIIQSLKITVKGLKIYRVTRLRLES